MIKRQHMGFLRFLLSIPVLLVALTVVAQGESGTIRIMQLDAAEFPQVALRIVATDTQNNALSELSALSLSEDGRPIDDFESQLEPVGVDVIFVIDANSTIAEIDELGGLTRREKVRDSIVRYATRYMDAAQRDRISIIVPDDSTGRFLGQADMRFANEVVNSINFYEPTELGETTPLNEMLLMAFDQAKSHQADGRSQAIILLTDGAQLADQLEYDRLIETADESAAAVYGLILGNRADSAEIENVTRLTAPTGGAYKHMPEADDADSLYGMVDAFGDQTLIRYRSRLSESGQHIVRADLDGVRAEMPFELTVEPAQVQIAVDNSRPIRRVATESGMPLAEIDPRKQPLVAEVRWPDGHPRLLTSASLVVDGTATPLEAPVLSDDGSLTFDWDISQLDAGVYDLQVQVTDELGLSGLSQSLPLTIDVVQLTPPATPAPEPTPQPEPIEESTPLRSWVQNNLFLLVGILSAVVVVGILFLGIVALFVRSQGPGSALPATGVPTQDGQGDSMAHSSSPEAASEMIAYLEPVEYAQEHPELILLDSPNVALGRDPRVVQVCFDDKSVSRLHARILSSHGLYRIYDEGSSSGTYVNYERLGLASRALTDSDHIHLGRVHLRFRLVEAPADGQQEL